MDNDWFVKEVGMDAALTQISMLIAKSARKITHDASEEQIAEARKEIDFYLGERMKVYRGDKELIRKYVDMKVEE